MTRKGSRDHPGPAACAVLLGIDYGPDGYRAVTASGPTNAACRYSSGDPEADWRSACEWAVEKAATHGCGVTMLSSCTHFVFDVEGWRFDEHDRLVRDAGEAAARD